MGRFTLERCKITITFMKHLVSLVLLGMLILSCNSQPPCTDERIAALIQSDSSAIHFLDGFCLNEKEALMLQSGCSNEELMLQSGCEKFGGNVFTVGLFDTAFHPVSEIAPFMYDNTFKYKGTYKENWSYVPDDIPGRNGEIFRVAKQGHLVLGLSQWNLRQFDIDQKKIQLIAEMDIKHYSFSKSACSDQIFISLSDLAPTDLSVRNDSVFMEFGFFRSPQKPVYGKIILDEKLNVSSFLPDSFCVVVEFPDRRRFEKGTCTIEQWQKNNQGKELSIDTLGSPCLFPNVNSSLLKNYSNQGKSLKQPA